MYLRREWVIEFFKIGDSWLKAWKKADILAPVEGSRSKLFLASDVRSLLPHRSYDLLTRHLLRPSEAVALSGVGLQQLRTWSSEGLNIAVRLPPLPGERGAGNYRYIPGELEVAMRVPSKMKGAYLIGTMSVELEIPEDELEDWIANGSLPASRHPSSGSLLILASDVRLRLVQQYREQRGNCI